MTHDSAKWDIYWGVRKYDQDCTAWLTRRLGFQPVEDHFIAAGILPFEDNVIHGNLLTTAGLQRITNLLINSGATQALTQTSGRIGTGNSSTAAAVGQTDLQAAAGSTNRFFNILDAASLTAVNGLVSLKATFASADGNYAWNEFGIDISTGTAANSAVVSATGPLLNRAVISQGTKVAGQSWTASATITFS